MMTTTKIAKPEAARSRAIRRHAKPVGPQHGSTAFLQRHLGNHRIQRITATGGPVLQRACACGGTCAHCAGHDDEARLQTKLTVGAPGDRYEQEADRVADRVMRMPEAGALEHAAAPAIQRLAAGSLAGGSPTGGSANVPLPRGGGRPLSPETRAFMEPRFGVDFGGVRLHTGAQAEGTAAQLRARAFTYGQDLWLGRGAAESDRHLMAHELVHTLQQGMGANPSALTPAPLSVQRVCGSSAIGSPTGCTSLGGVDVFDLSSSSNELFLFEYDCDDFRPGEEGRLTSVAAGLGSGAVVNIHGFASEEGAADFNDHLSCARGLKARMALIGAGIPAASISNVFSHGATPGLRDVHRSVVIPSAPPPPSIPSQTCGPNATDWFIRQVSTAKTDSTILALQQRLAGAERVARRYGFSAEEVAIGAVARKVLSEEARVGSPPRTPSARSQIASSVPGQRAFARALVAATAPIPFAGAPEQLVLAAIRGAALTWKDLVGTGRKYDFKNRSETLQSPNTEHCPGGCANTVTLCPEVLNNCFVKDVPGNLFYAHIGRFVGWSELVLQLGSQFAQLDSSARWDPPEDTRMIRFAFGLPDPLTRSALCSAIDANRSIFTIQACANCTEPVQADVV